MKHVQPTAFNQKSRSKDTPSSSQNVVEDPQEEEVVVDALEEDSDINAASLKGPFQTGPRTMISLWTIDIMWHIVSGTARRVQC
ncbi:hypothetical protein QJS04_geneDACA017824 [Acorus gramineus]|uniref:Uncharacterized protein n=1 Tax=Acorus gramineus TaxID=55184 RepID=A0AAV9A3G7_ACOGR|nr:hypothetical protein QJS04_geneDACA017824 [Acorus gramineus]